MRDGIKQASKHVYDFACKLRSVRSREGRLCISDCIRYVQRSNMRSRHCELQDSYSQATARPMLGCTRKTVQKQDEIALRSSTSYLSRRREHEYDIAFAPEKANSVCKVVNRRRPTTVARIARRYHNRRCPPSMRPRVRSGARRQRYWRHAVVAVKKIRAIREGCTSTRSQSSKDARRRVACRRGGCVMRGQNLAAASPFH